MSDYFKLDRLNVVTSREWPYIMEIFGLFTHVSLDIISFKSGNTLLF